MSTLATPRRPGRAGFTLLEVLVAVSILGLGLTVILSSQVGLFSSSQRASNLSLATHLARCRMNETEVELLKDGYPIIEESKDDGPCCEEESESRFRCKRLIQRIELPQPAGEGADGGAGVGGSALGDAGAALNLTANPMAGGGLEALSGLGPLGALASIQQTGGQALEGNSFGGLMGEAAAGGTQGLVSMLMGMVYPDLKKMLEASIRKVTITVAWKEGRVERELAVTQFVANPMQGGIDPNAAQGLEALDSLGGLFGGAASGSGSNTTGTGTESNTPGSPQ